MTDTREKLEQHLRLALARKTKPVGSLGVLEDLVVQLGLLQNTVSPALNNPHCLVFAADHGVTEEQVSAYPKEVTAQMAHNFLQGGAAINVLCRRQNITFKLVDAGIDAVLPDHPLLIQAKVGMGTRNFTRDLAMTGEELRQCLMSGASIVKHLHQQGCNVLMLGEMGIGNTTAAAALVSRLCQWSADDTVGPGTGLDPAQLAHKRAVVTRALGLHWTMTHPLEVLGALGGFEIAMLVGAILKAGRLGMACVIDGYIVTAAALVAMLTEPSCRLSMFFSHVGAEPGHRKLLEQMKARPLLDLELRLGEGTGAVLAWPLLQAATDILSEMATFDQTGVAEKNP